MPERSLPQHPVPTTEAGFDGLGLDPQLLQAVAELGYRHPTPIQLRVIPSALAGRDLIGLAETGSGKTAAFVLPIVQRLRGGKGVRALILSPTREIALQTKAHADYFGASHRLRAASIVGGLNIRHQIDALARGMDILVATPGRLLDHAERGTVRLDQVTELVLDEADHMLDLGFMPQIHRILERLPAVRHTMMFSATMPPPIERLAQRFLTEPERIDITPVGKTASGIQHRLYLVDIDAKRPCILALLNQELGSTLVFTRRKVDAEWLAKMLVREGHPVERIHSDLSQQQRLAALDGFREGQHRILVATDVAARGIDVVGIRHIINYEIPDTVEDYIHRAGRTARGNAQGLVSTIATFLDKPMVKEIEQTLGFDLPRCTAPGVEPYVERTSKRTMRRRLR